MELFLSASFLFVSFLAHWAQVQLRDSREDAASTRADCRRWDQPLYQTIERLSPKAGDIIHDETVGYVQITDPADLVQRSLIRGNSYEKRTLDVIRKHLSPGATALDVGCYIGTHSMVMARAVGPTGRVYAFDPSAPAIAQLKRNLYLNEIENVTAIQKALGSTNTGGFIGESNPKNAGGKVSCTDEDIASGNLRCDTIANTSHRFEMVRLDDLDVDKIALIKIDVEGHELGVLMGGEKTLARDRPVIIVEVWDEQARAGTAENKTRVFSFLKKLGYRIERVEVANYLALPPAAQLKGAVLPDEL